MSHYLTLARRLVKSVSPFRPALQPDSYGDALDFAVCVLRDLDMIVQTTELDKR